MTATTQTTLKTNAATSEAPILSLRIRPSTDRVEVLQLWTELEQRIGHLGLSCSADWTEAWLNAYGDLVPHSFLLARNPETSTLQGICLICEGVNQKDGPLNIKTLHVGPAGEPEADSVCAGAGVWGCRGPRSLIGRVRSRARDLPHSMREGPLAAQQYSFRYPLVNG